MRILAFDLETRLSTSDLCPNDEQEGWAALRRGDGGISALVIWDYKEDWTYIYDDKSILAAVKHLEAADCVVGFYSEKFDIPVIEGVFGRKLALKHHYDIYSEISRANAQRGIIGRKGEFKLDTICKRIFGYGKNGHGATISNLMKEHRYAELFNYCAHDVKLTKDLFEYICKHNGIIPSINNTQLTIGIPDWIRDEINGDKCSLISPTQI
jgi:hypothetical protein